MVVVIERAGYQFPWSEGIFRDCLRVGYVCRVVEVGGDMAGYGIMSVGAGEAHMLNVCVREEYRCRGLARQACCCICWIGRAIAGMHEAFLEVRPSNTVGRRLYRSLGFEQVGMRRGYYQAPGGREDAACCGRIARRRDSPLTRRDAIMTDLAAEIARSDGRLRSSPTRTPARPRSPRSCCCSAARFRWPARSRGARRRATRPPTGCASSSSAAFR